MISSPPRQSFNGERAPSDKQFSPLVQQFLSYLKLEKHFSEYTVKSYGADLIQFGQFLSGEIGQQPQATSPQALPTSPDGITPAAHPPAATPSKVTAEEIDK